MSSGFAIRRAVLGATLFIVGTSAALAQVYDNPNLPRSPYALPEPTYRGPDVGAALDGNGQLHSSGQWRHWGDKRNTGEFFQQLVAPSGTLAIGPGSPNGLPTTRFCAYHPDQC